MDAATFTVMEPMIEAGRLPTFSRLIEEGASGPLETLTPTLSVVIWTTILTGMGPETHGIEGWKDSAGDQLAYSSDLILSPPLWRILSASEVSNLFVNFWASWPAEEVRGGLVTNRMRFAELPHRAFPSALQERLASIPAPPPFRPGPKSGLSGDSAPAVEGEGLLDQYRFHQDDLYALRLFRASRDEVQPQVASLFLRGLDLVQHGYWHTVDEAAIQLRPDRDDPPLVTLSYEFMDRILGELIREMDDPTVVVVSDHGMEAMTAPPPMIAGLNLNRLLERLGYLTFHPRPPDVEGPYKRRVDWSKTRAYTWGDSKPDLDRAIRINQAGREEGGIVQPTEAAVVIEALAADLEQLKSEEGAPLFPRVERIAPDRTERPDLVVDLNPEMPWDAVLMGSGAAIPVRDLGQPAISHNSGQHEEGPPGIILMMGDGVEKGVRLQGATVHDVAPTVLALAGVAPAADMKGRVLEEALTFEPPAPVPSHDGLAYRGPGQTAPNDEVDAAVEEELRGLGYIQ